MFINLLLSIRGETGRGITTRTAAELASSIVGALLEPIYRQIEPIKIGENQRAVSITRNYGSRLAEKSGVLRSQRILDYLVAAYPDHAFVIDREEAGRLFNNVEAPTIELDKMAEAMDAKLKHPRSGPIPRGAEVRFLSGEVQAPRSGARAPATKGTANEGTHAQPAVRNGRSGRRSTGTPGGGTTTAARRRAGNSHATAGKGNGKDAGAQR